MGVASNHEVAALKEELRQVTERLIRVELALQSPIEAREWPTVSVDTHAPRPTLKLKKDG